VGKLNNFERDFFGLCSSADQGSESCNTHPAENFTFKIASTKLDEDINPLKLKDYLFSQFGKDWIDWSPETVMLDILEGQGSDLLMNKIGALQVCYKTDTPWTEWHIFENVGRAFTSQDVDFMTFQPLSPGECSVTMDTMRSIKPNEDFSEEVLTYVASIAFKDNLVLLPVEMFKVSVDNILKNMIYFNGLREKVILSWDKVKNMDLTNKQFNLEDPIQNQLAKLTILKQYRKEFYE
jgi:hypothetical protein